MNLAATKDAAMAHTRAGIPSGGVVTKNIATKDIATKDIATKDIVTKNIATKDIAMRWTAQLLLHPVALVAIATLIVNDRYMKSAHPSWLTGKLSDAAGLVFAPLLVLVAARLPRTWRAAVVAAIGTAIVFALVKTVPAATDVYRQVLGVLQWPFQAVHALLVGDAVHGVQSVEAVTDATDVWCVPFAGLAVWVTASTCRSAAARSRPR